MKSKILFISNIFIWIFTIIISYLIINGQIDDFKLFLGISLISLVLISLFYIGQQISKGLIILILFNLLFIGFCVYLLTLSIQLDVSR
jgi:hypothetical protein